MGQLNSTDGPGEPGPGSRPSQGLAGVLDRNIRALHEKRREEQRAARIQDRIAERITRFAGSMAFAYLHLALIAVWVMCNIGWLPGIAPFDPTFVILATVASVEAIFLSTFVLISQNRAAASADRRDDLDLQINLLSEHEITRLLRLTVAIAEHLGVGAGDDPRLRELQQNVAPERVLDELSEVEREAGRR